MPEAQWPEPRIFARSDASWTDFQEQIDALRGECARIANQLGIAASTLAPRAALEAIARSQPRTLDEIMEKGGLLRWQAELVQGVVEKHLRSTKEESASEK
jgi:ribonuclease D